MKQQQEEYLLAKWAEGKATPEEVQTLSLTYDLDELKIVLEANKLLDIDSTPNDIIYEKVLKNIEAVKINMRRRIFFVVLGAVIVGALAYFALGMAGTPTTKSTLPGQRDTILFADNTQVILGPSSSLIYDEASFISDRAFELSGQAYFKVPTKGPLKVKSVFGEVSVLGTEFDIYSLSNEMHRVSCYEGKVRVANIQTSSYKDLSHGERITIRKGQFDDKTLISTTSPDWVRNEVNYNNVPLDEVLVDLSRYFRVTFNKDASLKTTTFNGVVPIGTLDACLDYFVTVTGWKYDKKSDSVSFSK